ncbi:MAG: diheme cytochrome c [Rhodobacter sp.]|nr:diheme cytochrome c [Rhodobacter sp.]
MIRFPKAATAAAGCLMLAIALPAAGQQTAAELATQECSACHVLYPPSFLPPQSWQRITSTLDQHFGEDASLPEDQAAKIRDYLVAHASSRFPTMSVDQAPLRISELSWFKGEHRRLFERARNDPAIGSISNCGGCHRMDGYYEK